MGSTVILSKEMFRAKFWSRVRVGKANDCWPWRGTMRNKKKYGQIGYRKRYLAAHRVAWELSVGPVARGLWVLHKCDNQQCCNPRHLFLGTRQDNIDDMMKKGRAASHKGEKNGRAKLTEEMVRTLRTEHDFNGMSFEGLANKYRVAKVTIAKIVQRRLWKHVV